MILTGVIPLMSIISNPLLLLTSFGTRSFPFSYHTYDYLGMKPRTYDSIYELVKEICDSRVYAGIHYTYSCTAAAEQGRKIAQNINNTLEFGKE
jgi:hypothetical protein